MYDKSKIIKELEQASISMEQGQSLAKYTSWKIGGPADILVVADSAEMIQSVHQICAKNGVPLTIIGGGSDILISDQGIRGVVIINKAKEIEILDHSATKDTLTDSESDQYSIWTKVEVEPRHGEAGSDFYTFEDLDYEESGTTKLVKFDSGVVVSYAIAWGLKNGLTGLQWFAGIPGTMGGALYNNIHGGTRHFSDSFVGATIIDEDGVKEVGPEYFDFAYDQSVLRDKPQVIVLNVTIAMLCESDVEKAKYVAQEWARRKRLQPRVSAGCIFQNIHKEDKYRLGFASQSVGYIVDKQLHWAGKKEGNAMISDKHAAFIENTGEATAHDVLTLIKAIKNEIKTQYKVDLSLEINLLGFEPDELADLK